MFPIAAIHHRFLSALFVLSCLSACAPVLSANETTPPVETPFSDVTPTPWVLFDPKDADVNWLTQTPTAWPKLSRADCERGLCPPTPTPWPLPPADLAFVDNIPYVIVAYPGQTIAFTNHFEPHGRFQTLIGGVGSEYQTYGVTILKVLETPSWTATTHTRYWLFEAVNPGKAELYFRQIDFHCPPPPGECLPGETRITIEVLPTPSATLHP